MKKNIYHYLLLILSLLTALPASAHHPDSDGDEFVEKVSQRLSELKAYNEANIARGEAEKNVYVLDLSRLDEPYSNVHDLWENKSQDEVPFLISDQTKRTINDHLIELDSESGIQCFLLINYFFSQVEESDKDSYKEKQKEWTEAIFNKSKIGGSNHDGALIHATHKLSPVILSESDKEKYELYQDYFITVGQYYNFEKPFVFSSNENVNEDLKTNVFSITNDLLDKNLGGNSGTLLSQSFLDYISTQEYEKNESTDKLIEDIVSELNKRNEVLIQDYGKIKVEELSSIEKILYLEGQKVTQKNLQKYLDKLRTIQAGAKEIEERVLATSSTEYEQLRLLSRLTSINASEYLSWEVRERLLVAWANKEYLASNGWLGYDENKVIELIVKTPKQDAQKLLEFFRSDYLLKFYRDLEDIGGADHNTVFVNSLLQVVKTVFDEKLKGIEGVSEDEKYLKLKEDKIIKDFVYFIPSQCGKTFSFSEKNDSTYNIKSKWCSVSYNFNGYNYSPVFEVKELSDEDFAPLDFVLIIKGEDFSLSNPEGFLNKKFDAEVVPAIYFKYLKKEDNIRLASNIGMGTLAVASFAIPGTVLVRAVIGGQYLIASLAATDLIANVALEITTSQKVSQYLIKRYGQANARAFIGVLNGLNFVSGNFSGTVTVAKSSKIAENLADISKQLPASDAKTFISVVDDIAANTDKLIKTGDFTAEQIESLKKSAKFVQDDLSKGGKGLEKVSVVLDGSDWFDNIPAGLKVDLGWQESDLYKFFAGSSNRSDLVDSWKVLGDHPILRKKPENLEKISKWLDEGIEPQKLTDGIAKSPSKQNLIDQLGTAKSKVHAQVLIKDYDNIPGVAKGRYTPNGSSLSDKIDLPNGWANDLNLPENQIRNFTGKIEPLELKPGDKIYRVSSADGAGGPYWTRTKPEKLEDVIGGTAVLPEWNNFQHLHEYTIPNGVTIKSWKGKTASQPVSYKPDGTPLPSNYHLPGGDEQLFISFIGRQDPNFDIAVKSVEVSW